MTIYLQWQYIDNGNILTIILAIDKEFIEFFWRKSLLNISQTWIPGIGYDLLWFDYLQQQFIETGMTDLLDPRFAAGLVFSFEVILFLVVTPIGYGEAVLKYNFYFCIVSMK